MDDRRGPPHDLLDRRVDRAVEVVEQDLALVGMARELEEAVTDGVARGLVAGHHQQHEERSELGSGQSLAFDLGLHQRGGDVVAGVGQPVLAELLGVLPQLPSGLERPLDRAAVLRIGAAQHDVRAGEDEVLVRFGNAHHLADDVERKTGGDLLDEVDLPLRRHLIDELGGEVADVVRELVDRARREAAVHDEPQLGVARRVHVDHRAEQLVHLGGEVGHVGALSRDEEVGVAAGEHHVVVLDQRPVAGTGRHHLEARLGVERHGPFTAQLGEHRLPTQLGVRPRLEVAEVDVLCSDGVLGQHQCHAFDGNPCGDVWAFHRPHDEQTPKRRQTLRSRRCLLARRSRRR